MQAHDRYLHDATYLQAVARELDYPDLDAMFVAIGDQRLSATDIAERLIDRIDNPVQMRGASY